MAAEPPNASDDKSKRVGPLHFGPVGYGTPDLKPAPPPPKPPTPTPRPTPTPAPESLEHLEQTWLNTLERERAKIPSLADAFHPGRVATPAEIGAVVTHARRIERSYEGFLPIARRLAARGHARLLERVEAYVDDMKATSAIYAKMQQDAGAYVRALRRDA